MGLPTSGGLAISDINVQLGYAWNRNTNLNETAVRDLAGVPSGAISMSNFYGKPRATASYVTKGKSTADSSLYTFTSQSFGAEHIDRFIIVTVAGGTVSSATIGGVAATIAYNANNNAILIAKVPTGTTGTIAIQFTSSLFRMGWSLYQAINIKSISPIHTAGSTSNPSSLNANIGAEDIVIGCSHSNGTSTTVTWTGLTEYVDEFIGENNQCYSSALYVSNAAESPRTISCAFNVTNGPSAAIAVFR